MVLSTFYVFLVRVILHYFYENETQNTLDQPLTPFWYAIFCKNSYYETQNCLKIENIFLRVISKYLMRMRKVGI